MGGNDMAEIGIQTEESSVPECVPDAVVDLLQAWVFEKDGAEGRRLKELIELAKVMTQKVKDAEKEAKQRATQAQKMQRRRRAGQRRRQTRRRLRRRQKRRRKPREC